MRSTVLKKIKPTRKEEQNMRRVAKAIIDKIKIPKTKIEMGGSGAKGTWLTGNHDIDIYVKFDHEHYAGMDISQILQDRIKFKDYRVVHGSRDYVQMEKEGFDIELIPIMEIKKVEDADNITDISPFHKKWVRKHKELTDDIRLAKAFAKANGFYGAESYIKGFSGYSMEVLTIYYGGFTKLLKNVAQWKSKTVIDPENWHKGRVQLNKSKTQTPLILVDPVQATRNMTAVISREKYTLFKKSARRYLKNPSDSFFVKEQFSVESTLKNNKGRMIFVHIEPLDGKRDVVGAKLLKSFDFIHRHLHEHDFKIKGADWHWEEKAILWFAVTNTVRSKQIKHYGPPMESKDRVKSFKKKWKGYKLQEEKGVSYVVVDRKYDTPEELITDILEHEYVTSRIGKVLDQRTYD